MQQSMVRLPIEMNDIFLNMVVVVFCLCAAIITAL